MSMFLDEAEARYGRTGQRIGCPVDDWVSNFIHLLTSMS
jgi:hypothetical protein